MLTIISNRRELILHVLLLRPRWGFTCEAHAERHVSDTRDPKCNCYHSAASYRLPSPSDLGSLGLEQPLFAYPWRTGNGMNAVSL